MEEEKNVEISIDQLNKLQKAIYETMDLIGDISIVGYTRDKLRKDTQRNLVKAYDTLYALNKYIEKLKGKINEKL